MTRRGVRIAALLGAALFTLTSCGRLEDDAEELRSFLSRSEVGAQSFTFVEAAKDRWFAVRGAIQDDLRYRLILAGPKGDLAEMIFYDDALAVRLLDPAAFTASGATFGHPNTTGALMAGRWVTDPAGAPAIGQPRTQQNARAPIDPLERGVAALRTVRTQMGDSRTVREFNLESIDYRPSEDPWSYPNEEAGEKRFDLLRPLLPTREDQAQQGQIRIGESMFRKVSVYTKAGRVYRICEMVDVLGHEEFKRMEENNTRNQYLEDVRKQVLEGRTEVPVRERSVYATVAYPPKVTVTLPRGALIARLGDFLSGLRAAFTKGLIAPGGPAPQECLRPATAES